MKQQKPLLEKEDSSLKGLLKVAVVGFVALASFFLCSPQKAQHQKITLKFPSKTALVYIRRNIILYVEKTGKLMPIVVLLRKI